MARLGAPFKIVDNDLRPFRLEVAKRIAALNTTIGKSADASIAAADRARVRTQVAREFFRAEHGREPLTRGNWPAQIAKDSRPRTQTVAGYDLTFSPVKSVSTLWAVAEPAVAAVIEEAHRAAVKRQRDRTQRDIGTWSRRLATSKIIKRRPSEVLRDEEVTGSNPVTPTTVRPCQSPFRQ